MFACILLVSDSYKTRITLMLVLKRLILVSNVRFLDLQIFLTWMKAALDLAPLFKGIYKVQINLNSIDSIVTMLIATKMYLDIPPFH